MRINSIAYPISYTQRYEIPLHQGDNYAPVMPAINVPPDEFESRRGEIITSDYKLLNRSTTYFFREDVDWKDLGEYLKENYDINNTDFYCFGCSTGEEAFSLAILLKHIFGDFPAGKKIQASDIAESRIKFAKKKQRVRDTLFKSFDWLSDIGIDPKDSYKYFEHKSKYKLVRIFGGYGIRKVEGNHFSKAVTKSIKFSEKNILDSVKEFSESRPSVIFARNLWPYNKPVEYQPFADELYKKLAPGSMIMIGNFDYCGEAEVPDSNTFPIALKNAGFEPVPRGTNYSQEDEKKENHLIFKK